jgi:hypothetical protein
VGHPARLQCSARASFVLGGSVRVLKTISTS